MPSVLRNLFVQVCFVAILGLLISVCANMFVIGLKYFEESRANPTYVIRYLEFEIAVLPVLFLVFSVGLVVLIKKIGNIQKWENPADIIFCAQNQKVNLQSGRVFSPFWHHSYLWLVGFTRSIRADSAPWRNNRGHIF